MAHPQSTSANFNDSSNRRSRSSTGNTMDWKSNATEEQPIEKVIEKSGSIKSVANKGNMAVGSGNAAWSRNPRSMQIIPNTSSALSDVDLQLQPAFIGGQGVAQIVQRGARIYGEPDNHDPVDDMLEVPPSQTQQRLPPKDLWNKSSHHSDNVQKEERTQRTQGSARPHSGMSIRPKQLHMVDRQGEFHYGYQHNWQSVQQQQLDLALNNQLLQAISGPSFTEQSRQGQFPANNTGKLDVTMPSNIYASMQQIHTQMSNVETTLSKSHKQQQQKHSNALPPQHVQRAQKQQQRLSQSLNNGDLGKVNLPRVEQGRRLPLEEIQRILEMQRKNNPAPTYQPHAHNQSNPDGFDIILSHHQPQVSSDIQHARDNGNAQHAEPQLASDVRLVSAPLPQIHSVLPSTVPPENVVRQTQEAPNTPVIKDFPKRMKATARDILEQTKFSQGQQNSFSQPLMNNSTDTYERRLQNAARLSSSFFGAPEVQSQGRNVSSASFPPMPQAQPGRQPDVLQENQDHQVSVKNSPFPPWNENQQHVDISRSSARRLTNKEERACYQRIKDKTAELHAALALRKSLEEELVRNNQKSEECSTRIYENFRNIRKRPTMLMQSLLDWNEGFSTDGYGYSVADKIENYDDEGDDEENQKNLNADDVAPANGSLLSFPHQEIPDYFTQDIDEGSSFGSVGSRTPSGPPKKRRPGRPRVRPLRGVGRGR